MKTYTCDDCGATVSEETDFWFTDWKAPSEIYCLPCGPKHGFPHAVGEPVEDGWEPTDAFSQYEDPDGSVPAEPTPQQVNEWDAALEWETDHREPSPADEECDGCGKTFANGSLTPESDHPNAPWKCEGCSTDCPF